MAEIFTEETQKLILAEAKIQTAYAKIIVSKWGVDSWKSVQELVRAGAGPKCFPVGTQFNVAHSSYGTLVFDVVAHNVHKNPNDASAPTMTLLQHDVIYYTQFDASEYLWVNTTSAEMAAGTYHFAAYRSAYAGGTAEDGAYQFTTTKAIPVNGAVRHSTMGQWRSSYSKDSVLKGTFTIYDASGATIESGLATVEGTDGTDLGTCSTNYADTVNTLGTLNSTNRNAYGSNNWAESGIRQWLNADTESNWWKQQTIFDCKPSYSNNKGYINELDAEFVGVLGEVDNVTKHNTVFEADGVTSGSYTTRDKVFLLSRDELGYGIESDIAEGTVLDYYENATNTDRIKYDRSSPTTARYWWMRSPLPWSASVARFVHTSGGLDYYGANYGLGAVAACVIY